MPARETRRTPETDNIDSLIADLETGLSVDQHRLDDALQQQPDLFYRVAQALALAVSRKDAAKQSLEETEASADVRIRHAANEAGEKIREGDIEARKSLDVNVKRARDNLLSLQEQVGKLGALKEAYSQRGYAMTALTDLYTASYFTRSSAGRAQTDNARGRLDELKRMRRESR